jgi:hypothetical protein
MSFYFLTEFLKYFFRVLRVHEASSSWLKMCPRISVVTPCIKTLDTFHALRVKNDEFFRFLASPTFLNYQFLIFSINSTDLRFSLFDS